MKRKDLEVGQDYLFSTSADWEQWTTHTRVRVATLDLLYIDNNSHRWEVEQEHDITLSDGRTVRVHKSIRQATPGTSAERDAKRVVLVEMGHKAEEDDPNPAYHLVRLAQIRAPWAEGMATVQRLHADRQKREQARAAETAARREGFDRLTGLVSDLLGRKAKLTPRDDYRTVYLPLEDLTDIVGATTLPEMPSTMDAGAAALTLGVTRPTLLDMVSRGEIPTTKDDGDDVRIRAEDVLAALQRQRDLQRRAREELAYINDYLGGF